MKLLSPLFAVMLFIGSISSLWATTPYFPLMATPGTDPLYNGATFEKLKSLAIDIRWENISVKSALADLTTKIKKADPEHRGVKLSLYLPPNTLKSSYSKPVFILLDKCPTTDVLAYLCDQTDLTFEVHKDAVVLSPKDTQNKQSETSTVH